MQEQLKFGYDNSIKSNYEWKVESAIKRLKSFEPKDGYMVKQPIYLFTNRESER